MDWTSADIISIFQSNIINNYGTTATSVLVIYEYIITFDQEVRSMWSSLRTTVAIIFFLNRYTALVNAVFSLFSTINWASSAGCDAASTTLNILRLISFVLWAAFSPLRVYAISVRNLWLTLVTLCLGLIPLTTNILFYAGMTYSTQVVPVLGHECSISQSIKNIQKLAVATRTCLIASDTIVLLVTWINVYKLKTVVGQGNTDLLSLLSSLLRDGTFYFVILLLLDCMDLVLLLTNVYSGVITIFVVPISSVIISRFLLHLHQVYFSNSDSTRSTYDEGPQRNYTSTFMGSMGAPLSLGSCSRRDENFELEPDSTQLVCVDEDILEEFQTYKQTRHTDAEAYKLPHIPRDALEVDLTLVHVEVT